MNKAHKCTSDTHTQIILVLNSGQCEGRETSGFLAKDKSQKGELKKTNPAHKCSKVHKPQPFLSMQIRQFVYQSHNIQYMNVSDENC